MGYGFMVIVAFLVFSVTRTELGTEVRVAAVIAAAVISVAVLAASASG